MSRPFDAVIFDLGGVVLGWDPTRAFAEVLPPDQVEAFMTKIDFATWNSTHDAGQLFDVGEAELLERFPDDERAIRAYRTNFARTLTGTVPGTGAVIAELDRAGVGLVALTNWSAETFPHASGASGSCGGSPGSWCRARRSGQARSRHLLVGLWAVRSRPGPHGVRRRLRGQRRRRLGSRLDSHRVRRRRVAPGGPRALGLLETPQPVTEPVYHLAVAADWSAGAEYPWSTRGVSYDAEGYVHCSFAGQFAGVRNRYYADLADEEFARAGARSRQRS